MRPAEPLFCKTHIFIRSRAWGDFIWRRSLDNNAFFRPHIKKIKEKCLQMLDLLADFVVIYTSVGLALYRVLRFSPLDLLGDKGERRNAVVVA